MDKAKQKFRVWCPLIQNHFAPFSQPLPVGAKFLHLLHLTKLATELLLKRKSSCKKGESCHIFGIRGGVINSWRTSCVEHHAWKRSALKDAFDRHSAWDDFCFTSNVKLIKMKKQESVLSLLCHVLKYSGNITASVESPHQSSVNFHSEVTASLQWADLASLKTLWQIKQALFE